MKAPTLLFFFLSLVSTTYATFIPNNLALERINDRDAFNRGAKALITAIDVPLRQNLLRPKLPGSWKYFFEFGYRISDIDESEMGRYTSASNPSSIAHSVLGRVGMGLPLGFSISAGLSQSFSDEELTALTMSAAYQLFDFSTMVFTDFTPCMSVEGSVMRNLTQLAVYSLSTSFIAGVYHRNSMVQFAYAATYQYGLLVTLDPSVSRWFVHHSLISQTPIWDDFFIRTEIGIPHFSGTIFAGYEF